MTFSSLVKNSDSFPQKCKANVREALQKCWDGYNHVSSDPENIREYIADMKTTGGFAVWHCVQPFVVTFIVFLSMNYKKVTLPRLIDIDRDQKILILLSCCCFPFTLVFITPMPVTTHIYMFYLNVRGHIARSRSGFKIEMEKIEREIKEYEALGKL